MADTPFWRSSPYVGLLAAPYVSGTPLAAGHVANSVRALQAGLGRIADKENHSTRRIFGDAVDKVDFAAIEKAAAQLEKCFDLCKEVYGADKPEKLAPVVEKLSQDILALPVGESLLVPAGWVSLTNSGTLLYIVRRESPTMYSLVVANGGNALAYHPAKPFGEKMKYKTCCRVTRIPRTRIADMGFWTLTFLLSTKDPPSEYARAEVVYHVLLPWLAEVTTDHPEDTGPPKALGTDALSSILSGLVKPAAAAQPPAAGGFGLGAALLAAAGDKPAPVPAAPANEPPANLGSCLLSAIGGAEKAGAAAAAAAAAKPLPPRLLSEAFQETLDEPAAAWRTGCTATAHWKSVWEAVRYQLASAGMPDETLKLLSMALRKEFVVTASTDVLKCLRPDHPLITELTDRHNAVYKPLKLSTVTDALKNSREGTNYRTHDGDPVTPASVVERCSVIGIYVGASWCEPCKAFTPALVRLYERLRDKGFEIVHINADKTEEAFKEYHRTMPWPSMPYNAGRRAAGALGVEGIPALLLFDAKDGSLLTASGAAAIVQHADDFPWADRSVLRPRVTDDDARLLNFGAEQLCRKALKEFEKGTIAEGVLHNTHALADAVLRAADAGRTSDLEPIVAKSPETDLSIKPVRIDGEAAENPAVEVRDSVHVDRAGGFGHLLKKDVRKFEGAKQDLSALVDTDLLAIPGTVSTLDSALAAVVKCQEVCSRLIGLARESSTTSRIVLHLQVVSAIGGLFTSVMPLPRPRGDAACLWQGAFSAGVTGQKECLDNLHKLMVLYVSVWQSVERPTRSADSERFLVVSAMLCVFDAVVRQMYGDSDTLLLSALLAEDGGSYVSTKLCANGRAFEEVACRLELDMPHYTKALHGVMAYQASVKATCQNELFDWRMPEKIEVRKYGATGLFLRKLLERAGYPILPEDDPNPPCEMEALMNWLTQDNTPLAAQHPEFALLRDVSAMFRFAATMETRETELLRRRKDSTYQFWRLSFDDSLGKRGGVLWTRSRPGVAWDVAGVRGADMDIADIVVTGFGGRELRWGEGPVVQSPADVDTLLEMKNTTEDDVVHCRNLPTYADTLSREESERLMSSLTVRYITIPLVLDFFATMDRHTYLFNTGMQGLLRAVLFEPGCWGNDEARPEIPHVPLRQSAAQKKEAGVQSFMDATFKDYNQSLLGTPHGLLLNELRHTPHAVLRPLIAIATASLNDLSACSVYSANAHYMCYILDLLLDVFAYASYAMDEAAVEVVAVIESCKAELAELLSGRCRAMLEAWRKEAEAANDMSTASVMHAFVAMVVQHDHSLSGVQELLGSASYVRNWHGFGLGRLRSDLLLGPEAEDMEPEQRLVRFLQAQGIDTNQLGKGTLEKYVSTTGRSRPLFLHVGRETIRVPTLVRTTAGTEGEAAAAKLPPWDMPEIKLFRLMHQHRPRLVSVTATADPPQRDALMNEVVRTALRNPGFSYTGWEAASEAGGKYRAKRAELNVDVQSCEVLWRNDALRPVPDSMTQFPDYETIFGREPLHCGVIKRYAHRHWVHVVGTEYDLEEWDEPSQAMLGEGFPTPIPKLGETDEEVAKRLQQEEEGASGAGGSAAGNEMLQGMIWQHKRRRTEEEPYVKVQDGVQYQGSRYTRELDAYAEVPHDVPEEDWAVSIIRTVIATLYPKTQPLKFPFYLPSTNASKDDKTITLLGCDGPSEDSLTWKEMRVHKDTSVLEVWMLGTHGRRLFKTLIFSSNARLCLHNLSPDPQKAHAHKHLRFAAGNIKQRRVHGPSLVITRLSKKLGGTERYVPPLLLQGMLPSAFLEAYNMWLGEDDVIRGEPLDTTSSWFDYTFEVHVQPDGTATVHRRANHAGHTRIAHETDEGRLFRNETEVETPAEEAAEASPPPPSQELVDAMLALGLGHSAAAVRHALRKKDNSLDAAAQWLMDDANVAEIAELPADEEAPADDAMGEEAVPAPPAAGAGGVEAMVVDGEDDVDMERVDSSRDVITRELSHSALDDKARNVLAWLPMLVDEGFHHSVASHALSAHDGNVDLARQWLLDDANKDVVRTVLSGDVEQAKLGLIHSDRYLLPLCDTTDAMGRCLARLLGGVEDLSHVLVWATGDGQGAGKISVVELPRLRLKLQPQRDLDGRTQLCLIDQPGWYVCADPPARVAELLRPLPEHLLVTNRSSEYKVLVPNHDLVRPSIAGVAFPCRLVPLRTSVGWEEVMDQRLYSYPVHVSNSFLVSSGLGPTLYLLLVNLLSRRYREAYRLADGVCTDTALNADEQWVFDQLARSETDQHPDATACRLQLSIAVMYSPLRPKWELSDEVNRYVSVLPHVSGDCTLSRKELEAVVRRCAQGTPLIKNQLALLTCGDAEADLKPPPQMVPGSPWLKCFMSSQTYVDTHCTRLERLKSAGPAALADKELFDFLWSDALIQDDAGGGGKKLGVVWLYQALRGGVAMRIGGASVARTLSDLLTRWMHLKLSRWGKEAVEEGEVEGSLPRQMVQLAHVVRNPNREWPAFPTDPSSKAVLTGGVELYKGHGRESLVRAWVDALDREFLQALSASRAAGGSYDAATAALEKLRRCPLSQTSLSAALGAPAKGKPPVTDSSCARRVAAEARRASLDNPLAEACAGFVEWKAKDMSGVHDGLPFTVPKRALNTPVATAMLTRLEADVKRYRGMVAEGTDAELRGLSPAALEAAAAGEEEAAGAVCGVLTRLIAALEAVQTADSKEADTLISSLVQRVNAIPLPTPGRGGGAGEYTRRIRYAMARLARARSVLDLPHLAGLFISTESERDLRAVNPFAPSAVDDVTPILVLANRRAHANAVKAAAETLRSMVQKASPDGGLALGRQPSGSVGGGGGGGGGGETVLLNIKHAARSLADLLVQKRWYIGEDGGFDPRFLLFEFIFSIRLRKRQVEMVNWFASNLERGDSRVQQMIMGQGKTQVVSPLLVLLMADGKRLVTQVMPSALLQQTRAVLQSCFAAPVLPKKVFSLQFDRSVDDSPEAVQLLHSKLMTAAEDRGVVVAPPEAIKSLELKFVELLHSLDCTDLTSMDLDVTQLKRKEAVRVRDRLLARSEMADKLVDVLRLWHGGALFLDEVDVLLHPLRSELNFPIGNKHAIDLAGQRWGLPMFLFDAVFSAARGKLCLEHDAFWAAAEEASGLRVATLVDETREALHAGVAQDALQTSPHLVLLDTAYYHDAIKPVVAKWATLWLQRFMMTPPDCAAVAAFVAGGAAALKAEKANDMKLLVLARDWLGALLPHCLSKIDRVGYGLLQEADMVFVDPNCTVSRLLTAVPFVGKDVPSRSSEFAHPDVVIGLTTLAYRYEGLRKNDLKAIVSQLKKEYSRQYGPRDRRQACVLYSRWLRLGAELCGSSAESVLPLPLFHINDKKQFSRLYKLVRMVPEVLQHFLDHHVFPATMNFQRLKISACGHELGSDLLFGRRAGFSGTPSNLIPRDLGCCEYEPGSDGDIIHTLTSPLVTTAELKSRWSARSLLQDIARADPPYHALIDTGAYITNMDNNEVASYLLDHLPEWFEGVVFMDKADRKMVMLRNKRVVDLAQCGVAVGRRFTFYDQIHTTGIDIKHAATAKAVVTIGKDMTFRDYAQGAYRMRGIGKGQTIQLFVIKEVQCRIHADLGDNATSRAELDVPCWLLLNSMRFENLQAVKLGEQELQNLWRKHALGALVHDVVRGTAAGAEATPGARVRRFHGDGEEAGWLRRCIQEYREVISHDVCVEEGRSEHHRIAELLEEHKDFTRTDADRKRVEDVVREIHSASAGYADAGNLNFESEVVHEQEAEQEQEQEAEQEEQRESAFSRDDEHHNPWECRALALPLAQSVSATAHTTGESPFYPLNTFRATEVQPVLPFPEGLLLTDNFFRPTWLGMGERRLKVAYVVLRWTTATDAEAATAVVSLAEAETLRWMIHTRQASVTQLTGISLSTVYGGVVAGHGAEAALPTDSAQLLCVRFLNAEMYYTDSQLEILENALRLAALPDRRAFFFEALRLRQRQRGMFADTPVEKLFTPVAEWHLIRTRGQVEYIGQALKVAAAKGADVKEAFARHSTNGLATPQQLSMLLQAVVPGVAPGDLQSVVGTFPTDATPVEQFLEAFGLPQDLEPTPVAAPVEEKKEAGFWACRNCTFINAPLVTTCEICDFGWTGARECPRDKWACTPETGGCTFFNSKTLFYCEVCLVRSTRTHKRKHKHRSAAVHDPISQPWSSNRTGAFSFISL